MRIFVVITALLLSSAMARAQKPIEIRQFNTAQKAEWTRFTEYYNGNGNGTCLPIMSEQISKGECTRFNFTADLHIGNNGRITRVNVRESHILCADKAVEKELLKCFVETLHYEHAPFARLRNRVIRRAGL